MYIIKYGSQDDIHISSEHGNTMLFVDRNIPPTYYVCYPDIEGDDCLPEDAIPVEDNDDSSDDEELINSLQMTRITESEQMTLFKMACFHLASCDMSDPSQETTRCHRFDIESKLHDYDVDIFYEFKNKLNAYALDRLMLVCDSTSRGDMDNDLSQLFYETVSTKVVISEGNVWYYEDTIWKKSKNDHFLWNLLSTNFIRSIETDPSLSNASAYLNNYVSRKRIMEDVRLKLSYPNFESKIDSNKKIIGVKNGTLDIESGSLRESKVSDLISKNTNIEYIDYSMESREMSMLLKLMRRIFPDPDLLRFFIRSCSTFLEGENSKKVFYVWWGSGNNCKTGMATLIHSALGDYCGTAPVSLITSKRSSSTDATPELCHIEGKLVIFLQEPNPKEKMKTGRIKELTGNDKIFVRNLFQSGREMEVKCKIIHVCNFPTASPDTDIAFKRRMVVIKFPSTFVDTEEYERKKKLGTLGKNTFKIREGIEDIFRSMSTIFLSLIVKEFQVFREVGLQIPDIVRKNTEEFLTHSNYVLKFIRKQLIRVSEGESEIELSSHDIYESFKLWFRNMYPSYNIPNHETFIKELNDEGYIEEDGIIRNVYISDTNVNINLGF
jgi:P4 family phage/plasmid primase-like protien